MNEIQKAIEILKNSIWISVLERLPENDNDVLVTIKDKENGNLDVVITRYTDVYIGGRKLDYKDWVAPFPYFHPHYEVVAWKPLPEPYSELEEQTEQIPAPPMLILAGRRKKGGIDYGRI